MASAWGKITRRERSMYDAMIKANQDHNAALERLIERLEGE